jgi:hypothetical protein
MSLYGITLNPFTASPLLGLDADLIVDVPEEPDAFYLATLIVNDLCDIIQGDDELEAWAFAYER